MIQLRAALVLLSSLSAVALAAPVDKPVKLGSLSFEAPANVAAFTVRGEATKINASVKVDGMSAKEISVIVPVDALTTKMSMRDKHMRERVFQTADGKAPDVVFKASNVKCTGTPDKMECPASGTLSIRGTPKPAKFTISVVKDGGRSKASGASLVKLSDYGIPQPEQLGVKVSNDVTVRFEVLF